MTVPPWHPALARRWPLPRRFWTGLESRYGFGSGRTYRGGGSGRGGGGGTTTSLPPYLAIPAVAATGMVVYGYYSCLDEVPLTKRKRLLATTPEWEKQMGDQEYQSLLQRYRGQILPDTHRASATVRRVGSRIAKAADEFCAREAVEPASKAPYTFTVVRSEEANAFVLPGNHVFVLTGLFRYVSNEDDLAAVLGHEMAHNLARHAGERVSGAIVRSLVGRLVLFFDPSGLWYTLLGPAATLFQELPHSRDAEMEADHIGIYLAAHACYDPRAAQRVFRAMKDDASLGKKPGSRRPPEFLSTHPSYETRLDKFDEWMPHVLPILEEEDGHKCFHVRQEMAKARAQANQAASRREELAKKR